jgi:16S rRNA (cytosine1402-N4)-methyltransferase
MYSHLSVLTQELLHYFEGVPLCIMVDGTAGAGGHAAALLEAHPEIEQLIAIDRDPAALEIARKRLAPFAAKIIFIHANFAELEEILNRLNLPEIDGVLLDLGVSSMQLDEAERGFSFMQDAPLDMRMDPSQALSAREIVNTWEQRELEKLFRDYGEEPRWRAAAKRLVQARQLKPIETTQELVEILAPLLSRHKKRGLHPLTLIFQGLRLAVNGELEALQKALPVAVERLRKGGRLGCISFHSLEDRIVKQLFQQEASDKVSTTGLSGLFIAQIPRLKIVTRKPVMATREEVAENPRSRSAKLRVVEKL